MSDAAEPSELATSEPPPSPEAVQNTVEWLLQGHSTYDVINSLKDEFPNEHPESVMLAAADEIMKAAEMDPTAVTGWCIMATREIYKKSLAIGDFACALSAVKLIHNMARR